MEKYDTILIACADHEKRRHLSFVLNDHFNLLEATNIRQALLLLEQNVDCIAALVLTSGVIHEQELMKLTNNGEETLLAQVPTVIISEDDHRDKLESYLHAGAADVIPIDHDAYAMIRRIRTVAQLYLNQKKLETIEEETADRLRHSNDTIVDALSAIIEYRSVESGHHILRIRNFTRILMEEVMKSCPEYHLNDRLVTIISSAAALHDIGKIAIPDAILMKPGPLTQEEREVMQTHAATGCLILDTLEDMADQEYLRYAHNICHYHHERWDGKGYPDGLVGEKIPICAQVVGLADAYDALTSKRVYKESYPFDRAVNMILKGECGAFSPKLLECFKNVTEKYETLSLEYADGREAKDSPYDMTLPPLNSEKEDNALERTRNRYHSLIHYMNALVMEINLDKSLFQVDYNPYPELARIEKLTTLHELIAFMLDDVIVPEEREEMDRLIHEGVLIFIRENMRRSTHYFHYRGQDGEEDGLFEMTLLRANLSMRRALTLIFRKVQEQEQKYTQLPYILTEGSYVCRNDQNFTLVEVGQDAVGLGGYSKEELKQTFHGQLSELIYPDDRDMVRKEFTRQLKKGNTVHLEHRVCPKSGEVMWVSNKSVLFLGEDGQEYLYSFLTDVSPLHEAYDEMKDKLYRYRGILTRMETVLFEWDYETDSISFSDTWEKLFGFTPPKSQFQDWLLYGAHFHPDDVPLLLDCISNMESGLEYESVEARLATDQGRYIWCRFRAGSERDEEGRLKKIAGVISNIDAEKQEESSLKDKAERDSLTKLLNKAAGRKRIEDYLAHYPQGINCSMLIIDLDNFKQVNDQYGHLFGDAVLTRVSKNISKQFRDQDIVCRIGGDEFLVLVRGLSKREVLEYRCRQLIDSISSDMREQNCKLNMSCSIGIALCPEHGTSYYELFNHADQALYQVKAKGKNGFEFYDSSKSNFPEQMIRATAVSNQIDSDEEPGLADDNIVRHAFRLLYSAEKPEQAVHEVIAYLGRKTNVSRVYIFENSDDNRYCRNTFEWCNEGIQPEIDGLQSISYERDIPGYKDNFNEQGVFYCPDVKVLPKVTYDIVEPQGIKSMLQCAIRQDGVFRGYIGFDECVEQRLWTKEEIEALIYFSEILSVFLTRYREHEKLERQSEELRIIMDNQNALIYIIDPDTWTLKYINEKARQMVPNVCLEQPCYRALMGKSAPCAGCPANDIRNKRNARTVLADERYHREVLVDATMISWHGEDSCLITGHKIIKE